MSTQYDDPVRFVCSACGRPDVSEVYSGDRVADVIAELGQTMDVDTDAEYVSCSYCEAWCVVEDNIN